MSDTWWEYVDEHAVHIRDFIKKYSGTLAADTFDKAQADRLYLAASTLMQATWELAPDDPSIQLMPGFHAVCDLLDGTVPYEGDEDDTD